MASLLQFSSGVCPSLKIDKCAIFGSNKQIVLQTSNYKYKFLEPTRNGTGIIKCSNKIGTMKKREKEILRWRVGCNDDGSCGMAPQFESSPSTIDLINQFYKSINSKNNDKLEQLLSQDCEVHDLIFYTPFEGKKDVIGFFNGVMDAMGHSVHFSVERIAEGPNCTLAVMWHLEWEGRALPFTTGYSFFECTEVDGKLFIRKIKGIEELPVKPGDLLLKLLKAATTMFDNLPVAAKVFLLKSPDTHEALRMFRDVLSDRDHHGKS